MWCRQLFWTIPHARQKPSSFKKFCNQNIHTNTGREELHFQINQDKSLIEEQKIGTGCPKAVFGNAQGHRLRPDQKKRTSKGIRFAKYGNHKLGRRSVIEWAKVEIKFQSPKRTGMA